MQPVLKDATLQGDCLHTNGSLAESHDQLVSKPRQLHSLALKRTQNDGLLSKPDSQSKQIGSGVGHHVSASLGSTDQAVIAKAPARSRAEGGRKRRR